MKSRLFIPLFLLLAVPCLALPPFLQMMMAGRLTPTTVAAGASFTDTFNRADENPLSGGGNWTTAISPGGTIKLVSNKVVGATASNDNFARVTTTAATFNANQQATITIGGSAIADISACVRIASTSSIACYLIYVSNSTTLTMYKVSAAGAFTAQGANFTITAVVAGDTIGISASGSATTTLTVFRNGVSQGTRTDSSSPLTSGQPGLHIFNNNATQTIDSFTAVDL